MREDIDSRKAEHDVHHAQRKANLAEEDAQYAIDFAYSAIVEAEYAVLDAAVARMDADELSGRRGGSGHLKPESGLVPDSAMSARFAHRVAVRSSRPLAENVHRLGPGRHPGRPPAWRDEAVLRPGCGTGGGSQG